MTQDTYNRLTARYGAERVAKMFPRAVKALGPHTNEPATNTSRQ